MYIVILTKLFSTLPWVDVSQQETTKQVYLFSASIGLSPS